MSSIEKLDLKYLWHPFTQQSEWQRDIRRVPMVIAEGRGNFLCDQLGQKYFDGISSLWANLWGHRNSVLDRALKRQLGKLAHSTFLGLTHEPGIFLARDLITSAPKKLQRVFYSDSGATSVEIALKMAFQFHAQKKKRERLPRTEFLALRDSYHGDTLGAVSVGGTKLFHSRFKPLLFRTHFALSPHCLECPFRKSPTEKIRHTVYHYQNETPHPGQWRAETECHWECLSSVKKILEQRKGRLAAAILEPVVQGAAGIRVFPAGYVRGFFDLCRQAEVPVIADEVAVGFGRTGKLFAAFHENVQPDLMCLAKGISGGYLPLAATLVSEKIYRAFLGRYEEFKTFFHGHTYTANPLACAVGIASLQLFKRKNFWKELQSKIQLVQEESTRLLAITSIGQVRQAGLMIGIDLFHNASTLKRFPLQLRIGKKVCERARQEGLLLRPLGDTLVLMPPLSSSQKELQQLMRGVAKSITQTLKDVSL